MAPEAAAAVVVGGGIAGLATAAGLLCAGWCVTVLEQAGFDPVGAGIALEPNGVRALDWLGLSGALNSFEVAEGDSVLRTDAGRVLMRTSMEDLLRLFGTASYGLQRSQLHAILLDAASGVVLRTGCRVTDVIPGARARARGVRRT